MTKSKSILIIGGGAIGLCAAHFALRKGHKVTVVERGGPDRDCCSLGNAGFIAPSHIVPLAAPGMVRKALRWMLDPEGPFRLRPRLDGELLGWCWKFYSAATARHVARSAPILRDLGMESRRLFQELAEASGNEFGLVQKGILCLSRTEATHREEIEVAEMARALGIDADVLSPGEATRLEPALPMEIAGAVHFPQDSHVDPSRFLTWLLRTLEEGGAKVAWSTDALGFRAGAGRIEGLKTSRGDMAADEYVVAAGSWSSRILRSLGIRLPLQAGKGYSLTLPSPRRLPAIPSILVEGRVAVTPMGSALRFGGTMEIVGLDLSVEPARVRGILKTIPRYFPDLDLGDFRGVAPWCGLRPCSPDGLPYLGRFARYENLHAATGHAMLGLSLGPITGKLIAEILSEEKPSIDLSLLSPDRY